MWRALRALVMALLVVLALCSGDARSAQSTLTVYSSLPLVGAAKPQAHAIVRGARLALEERGSRAGTHAIRYVSLNDGTRIAGSWTPEAAFANARRAAADRSTIAYIGDFNSGATAVALPTLNERDVPQISPSNTAIGLTRGGPGADRGQPQRHYPTGRRSYVRLAANDRVQGAALAVAMKERGCTRVAAFNDGEVYGSGLGYWMRRRAAALGLPIVFERRIDPRARSYRRVARAARRARSDCTVFTGITANGAIQLFLDLGRALPRAQLFGGDGVAETGFTDPRDGGIPPRIARRLLVTIGGVAPSALPEAGRAFLDRYRMRYGESSPDPYALSGYEAMLLVLDAVTAVGADRRAVIDWLFSVRDRPSVLGTYGFDRYGDTTLRTFGLYRISEGALVWAGAVRADTKLAEDVSVVAPQRVIAT